MSPSTSSHLPTKAEKVCKLIGRVAKIPAIVFLPMKKNAT